MAIYNDLVLSGKGVSMTISNGDSAYNTLVRNGAKLNISSGGYVETTTVLNSTTISNAGSAVSTFLSGGTMVLSSGAVADTVSVLRNARLTVSSGAVATGLYVSSGNVNAVVKGGDETTLVTGVNEKGEFFLSNGVASNFLMNSLGQLTVSGGGIALNTTIRFGGYLTVMSGGVATGIEQAAGGFVRADVYGGDPNTVALGNNASGEFSLSGGVASNFILYDGGAQQVFSGGTAVHTLVSGQRAFQYVWSGGVASNTSIFKNGIANIYEGGIARDTTVSSGGSMVTNDGSLISGATVYGELLVTSGTSGEEESGGSATLSDIALMSGGIMKVSQNANFGGTISLNGTVKLTDSMTILDGAALAFDIFGRTSDSGAIISDWTKVSSPVGATYSLSVSVGETPVCGFYKLAGNAATFAETITVNSGATELGTLNAGEDFLEGGRRYSLTVDDADALLFTVADTVAPVLDGDPEAEVLGYSATITWNPAIDASGIKNYILRVDGADIVTAGTSYTLTDLACGDYSYQLKAVDIFDNESEWSTQQGFSVMDVTPKNVVLSATGATWYASPNVTGYVAEFSPDGFERSISFATPQTGIDFYNPAVGDYGFKVRADVDTVYSDVAEATVETAETGAVKFVSDNDGIGDAFFAQSNDVWHIGYYACHVGTAGWADGTGETVSLRGKQRISNVFRGSDDASILFLSDSDNGDALELDDCFTELPDGESVPIARFSRIGEVRAGAGDDIVDLTSSEFSGSDGMILRGGDGDDVIWSADGENLIFGDSGNDRLTGGAGNDVLCGGIGDDRMHGGGGDDIFTFCDNWGKDTVKQLAEGSVTLWFASGEESKWDASTLTYTDGNNSVTVMGIDSDKVTLKFGDDSSEQYAELNAQGAFAEYSSAKIFEDKNSIAVIASLA